MKKCLMLVFVLALVIGLLVGCARDREWVRNYHQFSLDPQTQTMEYDNLVIVNIDWKYYHKWPHSTIFGQDGRNYLLDTDCPGTRALAGPPEGRTKPTCFVFTSRSLMRRQDAEKLGFHPCTWCFPETSMKRY